MKKQDKSKISGSLAQLEAYCRERDYAGYSKFDALNSPALELLFGKNALCRLLVTQAVNRLPLPLRPLLGVRKSRNPKGIANFLKGYCDSYQLTGDPIHKVRLVSLADWLLQNHSATYGAYDGPGTAWGYNFPWQSPGFFAPRHYPNCIVTLFVADALLKAYQTVEDPRYLQAARRAGEFVLDALPVLESTKDTLCIGYVTAPLKWRVININAVAAGYLAKLGVCSGELRYQMAAKKMIHWVVGARNSNYSWNYTQPKSQSGIGPDNYHTGGILDGIADYMIQTGDTQFLDVYKKGLAYYADQFFTDDYAPKWRANKLFPHDTHGAAQGILSFSKAAYFEPSELTRAARILEWTMKNLRGPSGNFYYQKWRFFTWKLDLMRWSNSWMYWAMTTYQTTSTHSHKSALPLEGRDYDSQISPTPEVERHPSNSL